MHDAEPMSPEFLDDFLKGVGCGEPEAQPQPSASSSSWGNGKPFDMPSFITRHGIRVRSIQQRGSDTFYVLEECVFDSSHKGKDAAIIVRASGQLAYKCFHQSCVGKGWKALRQKFEPGYDQRKPEQQQKGQQRESPPTMPFPPSCRELYRDFPSLRPYILHGLLREGETLNCIAAPKLGKSWLALNAGLCVVTGKRFLGTFGTTPGRVLIVDNELHSETIAHRIPKVAEALGITLDEYADDLFVQSLRGQLRDINGLGRLLLQFEPGQFKLIVVDAFYRTLPKGTDENSNADVAALYNTIDTYADRLRCAFMLIHHSTKGNQTGKATTDIGAGAGSQSRAADAHMVLRPHAEPNTVVLEAVVRSSPPIAPICLQWEFPSWTLAEHLDPADLKTDKPRKSAPIPTTSSGVPFNPAKPTKFQQTLGRIEDVLREHGPMTKNAMKEHVTADPLANLLPAGGEDTLGMSLESLRWQPHRGRCGG